MNQLNLRVTLLEGQLMAQYSGLIRCRVFHHYAWVMFLTPVAFVPILLVAFSSHESRVGYVHNQYGINRSGT